MKTEKMSLANIKGKLSRSEMRTVMAGSGAGCTKCTKPGQMGNECSSSQICVNYVGTGPCGPGLYCL